MNSRVAIIDMGTNTFHLIIAEMTGGNHRILHTDRKAVKIGKGGINQGHITEDAIVRAIATLEEFKNTSKQFAVDSIFAFGTSALRSAKNSSNVVARIREKTGIDTRVISGEEEAELIYQGIRAGLKLGQKKSLIVDIGGGSVEFIIANESEIFWKASFEIGGQRLLELFQKHDPIEKQEIEDLEKYFVEKLESLFQQLAIHRVGTLIGSSGTFDTLSEIFCVRNGLRYEPEKGETPLTWDSFREIHAELVRKDRAARLRIPSMIELRVDMIVVACCLIDFLATQGGFTDVRVSSYSLKEGVLARLTNQGHLFQ